MGNWGEKRGLSRVILDRQTASPEGPLGLATIVIAVVIPEQHSTASRLELIVTVTVTVTLVVVVVVAVVGVNSRYHRTS
jgi:hypothetical protein